MWRATLTLLAGGAMAQALPLLLGPWIARLYSPAEFGHFSLVWTVGTNLAVVACARYEFALPLESTPSRAAALAALCGRILLAVSLASLLLGLAWSAWQDLALARWLGLVVLAGGLVQALVLWATRAQAYRALALSRVLQYGGGALAQLLFGLLAFGAAGLLLGPLLAALGAAAWLAAAAPPRGGWQVLLRRRPRAQWVALARQHRDFPLFNTPHAFASALQDSLAMVLLGTLANDASAGYWALALRYLKAPASLVGGALSQTLYPRLVAARDGVEARAVVRQAMLALAALALPMMAVLLLWGPPLFAWAFGDRWLAAGELARALSPYIAVHFIASPLAVCTLAWRAQAWALRVALAGQLLFVAGLLAGLLGSGMIGAAWGVSAAMLLYFGYYFWALAHWRHEPVPIAS